VQRPHPLHLHRTFISSCSCSLLFSISARDNSAFIMRTWGTRHNWWCVMQRVATESRKALHDVITGVNLAVLRSGSKTGNARCTRRYRTCYATRELRRVWHMWRSNRRLHDAALLSTEESRDNDAACAAARHRHTSRAALHAKRGEGRTHLGGLELALLLPAQRLQSIYLSRAMRVQLQQLAAAARRALQLLFFKLGPRAVGRWFHRGNIRRVRCE
jgi:hypothetical protein